MAQALEQARDRAQDLAARQQALHDETQQADANQLPQQAPPQNDLAGDTQEFAQEAPAANEPLQRAAYAMDQAGQALEQTQQQPALAHQEAALEALGEAVQAFEMALAQMDQGQHPAMAQTPQPAQQPAQQPSQQPTDQAMESTTQTQSEDTERSIGAKKDPAGRRVAREDAEWSPMAERERENLYQDYARELPIEYRELLEAYYEALAK
ncbi:MAG: DUF4175 family protein [Planctomycetota bacterium]